MIYLIYKKVVETEFMHTTQTFEKNKFLGEIIQINGKTANTAQNILAELRQIRKPVNPNNVVIGVVIQEKDAAVFQNHEIISLGNKWTTINEICKFAKAKLKYVNENDPILQPPTQN